MKRTIFPLLLLIPFLAAAQGPSGEEARRMNLRILSLLDQYERVSSFSEEKHVQEFRDLFVDPTLRCVYDDYFPSVTYGKSVSPDAYASGMDLSGDVLRTIQLSDIRKEGPFYSKDGTWHRTMSAVKSLYVIDASERAKASVGTNSPDGMYTEEKSEQVLFDVVFGPGEEEVRIASISKGTIDPGEAAPARQDAAPSKFEPKKIFLFPGNRKGTK